MIYIVKKTNIIGTNFHIYSVWEPDNDDHSTISSLTISNFINKNVNFPKIILFGRLGTNKLPENLEKLPALTQERKEAVQKFHQYIYQQAYEIIRLAYPNLQGQEDMGEISTLYELPTNEIKEVTFPI